MECKVLVMRDLVLKQQQDHSYRDNVLRQVPNLALNMNAGIERLHERTENKNGRPQQKSRDGDECAGCGTAICEPKVQRTAQINREEHRVQCEISSVSGPALYSQENDGKHAVHADQYPTEAVTESVDVDCAESDEKGSDRQQDCCRH